MTKFRHRLRSLGLLCCQFPKCSELKRPTDEHTWREDLDQWGQRGLRQLVQYYIYFLQWILVAIQEILRIWRGGGEGRVQLQENSLSFHFKACRCKYFLYYYSALKNKCSLFVSLPHGQARGQGHIAASLERVFAQANLKVIFWHHSSIFQCTYMWITD